MAKASDNPFPSILLVEQATAPTTPASGQARLYRGTDNKLYIVDDAGAATEIGAGGAGSSAPVVKWKHTTGTSTVLRLPTSFTFATLHDGTSVSVGTTYDLVLPSGSVSAGDTIECGAALGYGSEACDPYVSFGSIVGGSVVNTFFTGDGVPGLWATSGAYTNASGSDFYVVQSSDLSAGSLTIRPLGRTSTGGFRSILAGQFACWVKNWGPQ